MLSLQHQERFIFCEDSADSGFLGRSEGRYSEGEILVTTAMLSRRT